MNQSKKGKKKKNRVGWACESVVGKKEKGVGKRRSTNPGGIYDTPKGHK